MEKQVNWEEDLVPLESLDLTDPDKEEEEEDRKFGFIDIVAMTIAAYQIILPILLAMFGVVIVMYLIIRFLAR